MSDPYMRAGRGGAGNFYTKKDLEEVSKAAALEDIESQSNSVDVHDLSRSVTSSAPPPEYLHTGRGGAGNWVQPTALKSQGLSQATSPNPTSTTTNTNLFGAKRAVGQSKPTYRGGRGGAGNYTDFIAEDHWRKQEEERVRLDMERKVEQDVEAGLPRPPRAYGGVGGAWEMVYMR